MNAVPDGFRAPQAELAVAVLGVGAVGSALLGLLPRRPELCVIGVANSRGQVAATEGLDVASAIAELRGNPAPRHDAGLLAALRASGARQLALVDASASAQLAASHADWLAAGIHVVSANKLAIGAGLAGYVKLRESARLGGRRYGASATVGAGLPMLSTIRRLHACGDRVRRIEAVLSGSLSWLLNQFDGSRPFSALLSEARKLGYTEPDPRQDLDGHDVARKLAILARHAGMPLRYRQITVSGLLPASQPPHLDEALRQLDALMAERLLAASRNGTVLRHLAVLDAEGRAEVGLVEVDPEHPAAQLGGCDNLVALTTDSYRERPLVIQGAGAGPQVTAQALLGDLLEIVA